jgi:hypothetical protein
MGGATRGGGDRGGKILGSFVQAPSASSRKTLAQRVERPS